MRPFCLRRFAILLCMIPSLAIMFVIGSTHGAYGEYTCWYYRPSSSCRCRILTCDTATGTVQSTVNMCGNYNSASDCEEELNQPGLLYPSAGVCPSENTCPPPPNAAPTATGVSISGTVANGQTLTGSYTYADAESDPEGTTTFQWYTGTDANCTGKTAIDGATSKTYTIQAADMDKFLCFGVTPAATSGTSPGAEVLATTTAAVPANAAPTATGVSISGTASAGQTLTGNYTYSDAESDPEGTSTFQWYTGTDANCSGKTVLTGVNAQTYVVTDTEKGKFICFGVTPVATAGTLTGTETVATTAAPVDTPWYSSSPVPGVIPAMNAAAPANATTPLTVSNTGTAVLNITGITFSGTDAAKFSVSPNTFPVSIAAGGNREFTITCTGGTAAGTFNAAMAVAHDAAGSPANYTLSCTVTTAPIYSSSPAPNGTLTMSSYTPSNGTASLTVTNTGSAALNITGITFAGANPTKFSVSPNTFPVTIAVGGNRVFTISGNGSTAGTFNAAMAVAHDAAGSPADYTLKGIVSVYAESSYSPPANQAPVADKLSVCTDGNNPVSVTLSGTDPDLPGMNWFLLLLKPMSYSVVTQPQHGTLSGTPPNMVWTPEPGFSGTDSFTFRAYDGAAYSEPASVNIGTTPGGCFCVSDSYDINISCAEFQGMRYGATLNFIRIADDPSGLYWKLNLSGLRNSVPALGNCASVGNDLKMAIPCARYQGTEYQFTLNPAKPGGDPFMLYWKMDTGTLKQR